MGLVMRIGALVTAVGVLLAALAAEALAASDIRSVRLWRAPDNTRLVFDLSGPVQHSVFTLAAPDRIVIDVSGAKLATSLEQLSLANTPITGVRSASAALMTCAWSSICRHRCRQRALPWRLISNMAIAWWSICSIRAVRPPPRRRPALPPAHLLCRSRRPSHHRS